MEQGLSTVVAIPEAALRHPEWYRKMNMGAVS